MKKIFGLFILTILFFSGCAYFNIFYNARQYYNKGYEATRKNRTTQVTGTETQNYQKAIEKAAKLIDEYPDSKWVDDALLLMGKAYYYEQQYMRSNRKFVELITNYPQSDFVPEARLWLAKTNISLEKFEEAEEELQSLLKQDVSKELIGEANFYLGQLYNTQKDYQKAVESYEIAAKSTPKEMRALTLFEVGANYDSLGVYDKAAEAFKAVMKHDPVQELKLDARFRYTQMRKKTGLYDEAIKEFEMMLLDQRNTKLFPRIRLEIADCLAQKGDEKGALIAYEDITKELKGNEAAEAYYRMGEIYESRFNDYDRALEQFKQVKTTSSRSIFADSADVRARDIERYKALRLVIDMGLRGESGRLVVKNEKEDEDTLTVNRLFTRMDTTKTDSSRRAMIAEYRGQAFLDSLVEENGLTEDQRILPQWRDRLEKRKEIGGVDWIAWLENGSLPTDEEMAIERVAIKSHRLKSERDEIVRSAALSSFKVEEVDRNLFYLSEIYLFRFNLPDSAANAYRMIVSRFPQSEFAPQALFNLGYIASNIHHDTTSADTAYRRIVEDYPDSRFANWSRDWLGLPRMDEKADSLETRYREAERQLYQQENPKSAYEKFESIYETAPDSKWGEKSFYSMGWISEYRLDSLQLAYVLYDSLARRYPGSVYAKQIQPKLIAVRDAEQQKAAEEKQNTEQQQDSAGAALKQPVRVNENARQDSIDVASVPRAERDVKQLESRKEPSSDEMRERELLERHIEESSDTLRSNPVEKEPDERTMPLPEEVPANLKID